MKQLSVNVCLIRKASTRGNLEFLFDACITSLCLCLLLSVLTPLSSPPPPPSLPSPSLPFLAAGTTASSNAGAMNSLTSLGTLQGLAGATVGLNNINALAGSINSEYSPCHQPLHLHLHLHLPLTATIHFQRPQPASGRGETTCRGGRRSSELDLYGFSAHDF